MSHLTGGAMADKGRQEKASKHVTSHVAIHHDHGEGLMVPFSNLDIMVSKTQEWLFNPNVHDMTITTVMKDCVGFKEQKKWTRGSTA